MMTENDRLVHQRAAGWYSGPTSASKYWTNASKSALMERLGKYEDTGLTPAEIRQLLKTLHGEAVDLQQLLKVLRGEVADDD